MSILFKRGVVALSVLTLFGNNDNSSSSVNTEATQENTESEDT